MNNLHKLTNFIYIATIAIIPIIVLLQDTHIEPILIGDQCDLKNIFLVKYCEDDRKVISLEKKISGTLEAKDLQLKEKFEEHKTHRVVNKLMCLKYAYGCPSCLFWARSFTEGTCKYCGRKLIKSKYWSEILVVFDNKVCLYSGLFPHIKE